MKIKIRVVPNAKKVEVVEGEIFKVKVKSKPQRGRANEELIETLSKYFNIPKSKIRIIHGERSRDKVVEIEKT